MYALTCRAVVLAVGTPLLCNGPAPLQFRRIVCLTVDQELEDVLSGKSSSVYTANIMAFPFKWSKCVTGLLASNSHLSSGTHVLMCYEWCKYCALNDETVKLEDGSRLRWNSIQAYFIQSDQKDQLSKVQSTLRKNCRARISEVIPWYTTKCFLITTSLLSRFPRCRLNATDH